MRSRSNKEEHKMKFYYKGKLVRTSKTHEYKFAVMTANDKLCSCHGTLDAAQKALRSKIATLETEIQNCKKAIEASEEGKTRFEIKTGGRWYPVNLSVKDFCGRDRSQKSTWEEYIENAKRSIEQYKTRKIVELEMKG